MKLKLNEFKALYKAWKIGVPPLDHLLLSFLVWLEQKLIDQRVRTEVDEAIEEWKTLQGGLAPTHPLIPPTPPVYTETPSKTSTRLPEMRLTAPWYDPSDDGLEGRSRGAEEVP